MIKPYYGGIGSPQGTFPHSVPSTFPHLELPSHAFLFSRIDKTTGSFAQCYLSNKMSHTSAFICLALQSGFFHAENTTGRVGLWFQPLAYFIFGLLLLWAILTPDSSSLTLPAQLSSWQHIIKSLSPFLDVWLLTAFKPHSSPLLSHIWSCLWETQMFHHVVPGRYSEHSNLCVCV